MQGAYLQYCLMSTGSSQHSPYHGHLQSQTQATISDCVNYVHTVFEAILRDCTCLIDGLRRSRTHQLVLRQSCEHGGRRTTMAKLVTAACRHVAVHMQRRCVAVLQPADSF